MKRTHVGAVLAAALLVPAAAWAQGQGGGAAGQTSGTAQSAPRAALKTARDQMNQHVATYSDDRTSAKTACASKGQACAAAKAKVMADKAQLMADREALRQAFAQMKQLAAAEGQRRQQQQQKQK